MRRTKTKALPSNGLPNNWRTLGEFRLPSQTRTRTWLIMITHVLFNQTATRLNCLKNMFETTAIRGKCHIFDKLQSTCLHSWSRSLPTPILRPPETEPPNPENQPHLGQMLEKTNTQEPKAGRLPVPGVVCALYLPGRKNKAIISKTPTAEFQHQYLSFSQLM